MGTEKTTETTTRESLDTKIERLLAQDTPTTHAELTKVTAELTKTCKGLDGKLDKLKVAYDAIELQQKALQSKMAECYISLGGAIKTKNGN